MCEHHDDSKELQYVKSRRALLRGSGAAALAFASASQLGTVFVKAASRTITSTPEETMGPFWLDIATNRSDIRTDPTTGAAQAGLPLYLTVSVSQLANAKSTPVSAARIDLWHANAQGSYSDESTSSGNESNTVGTYWLRGYQSTDVHGMTRFITNYPAYYNGRAPHIHARVRTYSGTTVETNFTTQFFFADAITTEVYANNSEYATTTSRTYNAQDNVYSTVSTGSTTASPDGSRLLLRLADDGTYCIASFNIVLT